MALKKIHQCPYCQAKISYINLWMNKDRQSVKCDRCGCFCGISFYRNIKKKALLSILVSLIIFLIFIIIKRVSLYSIVLVIIPFIYFYTSFIGDMVLRAIPQPKLHNNLNNDDIYSFSKDGSSALEGAQTSVIPRVKKLEHDDVIFDNEDMGATRKINTTDLNDQNFDS